MKIDINSNDYTFSELEKLMKDKIKKKRSSQTLELIELTKHKQKIDKKINTLKKQCTHPRRYLKVECTSYYGNDGYGGSEYCNGRYSLVCNLCGEWDIVQVKDNADIL